MLTNFEMQEAKTLRETIDNSVFEFVLHPSIVEDMERLEYLESQCAHKYKEGKCIYCGKEEGK